MPVESQHDQYARELSKWKLVRDCVAGAKDVKHAGILYLPHPNESGEDAQARYKAYITRAIFTNFIKPTLDAMVGMAFRKAPEVKLPAQIDYLTKNATGDGVSLEQVGKNTVSNLLQTGRFGLLADYPSADEGLSNAQVKSLGLESHIKCYRPESIINWETTVINGKQVLSLVVLQEDYNEAVDEFESNAKTQYRVLRLTEGTYTVEVYRDNEAISHAEPRDYKGNRLTLIPMVLAGAYSNDPDVDDAALYDMAEINIGHYRNSADKEEGLFLHGQPMLHIDIGDMNTSSWTELNPNGVQVGARRGLITSGGGNATLLQTAPNSAVSEEMKNKVEDMRAIGVRIVSQNGQEETATAAVINHASTNSMLSNIVQNASSAITSVLEWNALFMGANGSIQYEINDDFYDKTLDPQQVIAQIQLFDRQIIAKQDMRSIARKSGMLDAERTDEMIDADAEDISPIE